MDEFSVTLFSNNSMSIYPNNVLSSFSNKLYKPIELNGEGWSVGIVEMYINELIKPRHEHCFIYSDIIKERYCGDQYTKCMRVFHLAPKSEKIFKFKPQYYPIQNNFIDEISILIADEEGEKIDFIASTVPTYVTLNFKKSNGKAIKDDRK